MSRCFSKLRFCGCHRKQKPVGDSEIIQRGEYNDANREKADDFSDREIRGDCLDWIFHKIIFRVSNFTQTISRKLDFD